MAGAPLLLLQTNTDLSQAEAVLQFWFNDCRPWQWFRQRDAFDALIIERFGSLVECALAGQLERWKERSNTCLALVLLLDQFTRQVYRGRPQAFSGDAQALEMSKRALANGWIARSTTTLFSLCSIGMSQNCRRARCGSAAIQQLARAL